MRSKLRKQEADTQGSLNLACVFFQPPSPGSSPQRSLVTRKRQKVQEAERLNAGLEAQGTKKMQDRGPAPLSPSHYPASSELGALRCPFPSLVRRHMGGRNHGGLLCCPLPSPDAPSQGSSEQEKKETKLFAQQPRMRPLLGLFIPVNLSRGGVGESSHFQVFSQHPKAPKYAPDCLPFLTLFCQVLC